MKINEKWNMMSESRKAYIEALFMAHVCGNKTIQHLLKGLKYER